MTESKCISSLVFLSFVVFNLLISTRAAAETLKLRPFKSDGCTSVPSNLPNFNGVDDFAHCCFVHDVVYWIGGSPQDKIEADKELVTCFNDANPATFVSNVPTHVVLATLGSGFWASGRQTKFHSTSFSKADSEYVAREIEAISRNLKKHTEDFRLNTNQMNYIDFWLNTFSSEFRK